MSERDALNAQESRKEVLSALLDGEAGELELRQLLRDLAGEPEQLAQWYRFQTAKAALHGEPVFHAPNFAASVRSAIDEDPSQEALPKAGGLTVIGRAIGSFAVAASVAAVVVVGGQQIAQTGVDDASQVARVGAVPVGVVNTAGAVPVQASYGTRALPVLEPADRTAYRELARQRLRRYSQEHAEHASLNTPQGMLPFARVPVIEQ